jgi:phage terminase large subunit GpA-like protein
VQIGVTSLKALGRLIRPALPDSGIKTNGANGANGSRAPRALNRFQWHKGFDDSFFEELTSEKKEIEWRDSRRIARWKKKKGHAHNEALDLAVMVLILFEAIQQPLEKRAADYLLPGVSKPAAAATAAAATPAPATNGNGNRPTRRMRRNVWGSGGIAGGLY